MLKVGYVVFLGALWFALSGHTEWYILTLGAASVILVAWLGSRMAVVDHEGFPMHLLLRSPAYLLWLAVEIFRSNIAIARLITRPELDVQPSRFRVTTGARTDEVRVTYANSITLTPGTVTLAVDDDSLEVHALTRDAAEDLAGGEMDRRVRRLEASS